MSEINSMNKYTLIGGTAALIADASEDELIGFVNTLFYYDLRDADEPDFTTIDQVKKALKANGYILTETN